MEEPFKRDVVGLGVDYPDVEMHTKCIVELRYQSLLVIRRIGSQANHGPSFYIKSLYDFVTGKIQDENAPFAVMNPIVFNTFLLILEQTTKFNPTLLSRKSFDIFIKTLGFVSRLLAVLTKDPPNSRGNEDITYANLLAITKSIGSIAKYFPNPAMISTITFHDKG